MSLHFRNSLLILLMLLGFVVRAQVTTSVFGKVVDELGEPLIGASVFLEGTQLGAQTDFEGKYEIERCAPGIL